MQYCYVKTVLMIGAVSSLGTEALAQNDPLPLTRWEYAPDNEVAVADATAKELIAQLKNEYVDNSRRTFRDAHPRGIGCVEATFTVASTFPQIFKNHQSGIFATPGKAYSAIIRYSSSLGPAGDNVNDARGMAIKVFGVDGPKLLGGQESATTQDFLQINAPFFPAHNAQDFFGMVKIKSNPSYLMTFLWEDPTGHGAELVALTNLQNNSFNGTSLVQQQFFSMVPYLLARSSGTGEGLPVKFSSRPCSAASRRPLNGLETQLRDDLQERLQNEGACFEFVMQQYNPNARLKQNIEDGMSVWEEADSPFYQVAKIDIPPQQFRTDDKLEYCDRLSYQPWHTTAKFRPLGNINRTRKIVYEKISLYRHEMNLEKSEYPEPRDITAFKSLTNNKYSVWQSVYVPRRTTDGGM